MSALTWFVPLLILLLHSSTTQAAAGSTAPTVDSLCLSEILINTPQPYDAGEIGAAQRKADSAREAIQQGANFEDIAKKYSDGPSAVYGGALGVFKRGQLAKSIEDKVFAMKVGEVSDVIRTKQGFTILKVTECGLMSGVRGASGPPGCGQIDVLTDTQGVDFGPYLRLMLSRVRENWYHLIPDSAKLKKGKVAIEFAITKDGKVADMRLVAGSGDRDLDRAAWGGISTSTPFPSLPSDFAGPYIALRWHFCYNPDTKAKPGIAVSISAPGDLEVRVGASEVVTATVTGTKENAVEWSVTGSGCSGSACGKMADGLYLAPTVLPNPPTVTVTAISKAYPSASASVTVHMVQAPPH